MWNHVLVGGGDVDGGGGGSSDGGGGNGSGCNSGDGGGGVVEEVLEVLVGHQHLGYGTDLCHSWLSINKKHEWTTSSDYGIRISVLSTERASHCGVIVELLPWNCNITGCVMHSEILSRPV